MKDLPAKLNLGVFNKDKVSCRPSFQIDRMIDGDASIVASGGTCES